MYFTNDRQLKNVTFNEKLVFKHAEKPIFMISDGTKWLVSSMITGKRFEFMLNGDSQCPIDNVGLSDPKWEFWDRHEYRVKKSVKSPSDFYYEFSQWENIGETPSKYFYHACISFIIKINMLLIIAHNKVQHLSSTLSATGWGFAKKPNFYYIYIFYNSSIL